MRPVLLTSLLLAAPSSSNPFEPHHPIRDVISPPTLPTISTISFSGSGCPADGDSITFVSRDWNNIIFHLDNFTTSTPGDATKTTNCQAHIQGIDTTPGWQFALKDVWVRGYLELEAGSTMTEYVTTYFSEDALDTATMQVSRSADDHEELRINQSVILHTETPKSSFMWSPCTNTRGSTGILNINFRVALTTSARNAHGYFGAAVNTTVTEKWGWVWRRC
ncbi:hypothetical protein BJ170DRAFT_694372 [Xylariales sp. AK1849]|nr:hypothetical protein BJ170DRAFT_694372 [Xylariales sp. AK1849]